MLDTLRRSADIQQICVLQQIYIYTHIYIRRHLPELERASLQLQSPMPSNPASPKPSNPDTPPGIQASRHPSIPDCRNPLFDHLKGVTAGPSRGPQGISARGAPAPPPFPLALKLVLPPAQECQKAHLTAIRASRHPSIQASGPRGRRQRR